MITDQARLSLRHLRIRTCMHACTQTTLMDRLLAQCGQAVQEDRAMDSNTLEKERGITILAKVTSFT